jgi:pimeloyl-ACP methyl ester carboxylesterase
MPEVFTRDNIPLKYHITGTGPTVVCILGYAMTQDEWPGRMISRLSESLRVIRYNHRGISGISNPDCPFTIPTAAEDLHDVISTLTDGQIHILGYSMGGMVGLEYALRYPQSLGRIVLISTHCGGDAMIPPNPQVIEEMGTEPSSLDEYLNRAGRLLLTESFRQTHPDPMSWFVDYGEPANPAAIREQYQAMDEWKGVYSELPRIIAPALVMCGDQDVVVPPENSQILADAMPHATLKIMKNAGHGFIFEDPVQIAEMVKEFFG